MINLRFVFSFGCCGYFCVKHVLKKRIKKESYMSVYRMKEILNENMYYCSCLKIYCIRNVNAKCITLIKSGKKSYHYVVIEKIVGDYVYFYDPLFIGVRKRKMDIFTKKWCNVCLFYTKV